MRLVSLSPATTEILFALSLDSQIVADTTFCNYPENAKRLIKVGTFSDPDIEKIAALKPDIIFATGLQQTPTVLRLRALNFKVVVSNPRTIPGLFASIREIASLTHTQETAEDLIRGIQKRIASISRKVARIPQEKRPKVFIEIWHDPVMTAGPGSFIDEMLTLSGGINIAYDTPRPYSRFSEETIISRNPDIIIAGYMAKGKAYELICKRMGWAQIRAVHTKQVICDINPDILLRPSPRLADGLEALYQRFYPPSRENS